MKNKKIKIPNDLKISHRISPNSFNESDNTIEVVFSTGAPGKRGYMYPYIEELSMKKSDVKLERLNAGAPVLNNHSRAQGLNGIIGVVEKAYIKDKQGIAVLRLSEREEFAGIVQDIKSGIIRNISVGYRVDKYKDVTKKGDEIPTYRAIDWTPMEISFVDIPFDMDSQARSVNNKEELQECLLETSQENTMTREQQINEMCAKAGLKDQEIIRSIIDSDIEIENVEARIKEEMDLRSKALEDEKESKETKKVQDEIVAEDVEDKKRESEEIKSRAALEERERISEIKLIGRSLNLEEKVIENNISEGTSINDFRKVAIEMKSEQDKLRKTNNFNVEAKDMNQRELSLRSAENALLNKSTSGKVELIESAREFRTMDLIDMARHFLKKEGHNVSLMHKNEIADRALHSSSDFKEILANTANKSLRDAYSIAGQTFDPIVNSTTVDDFKEISRTQLHSGSQLSELNEKGEYEHTTLSESAEKYSVKTFGKIVGITRKTLVNDDLGAFTRVPGTMGAKARTLESRLVWQQITLNPQMADGNALFSAAHGNIGGAGPINVANVNEGMSKMMLQTDLDGELLDIMPSYLVGPTALAATIKSFLGATVHTQDSEVNPFKGDLSAIIERRLDAASQSQWYLMANKAMIDMIEIARIAGEEGPVITQKEGFETDGLKLKVRYDFGVKVLDWRGFYRRG